MRSGTHLATTEESERRWCKSGQVKCEGSSNLRSGGMKLGRERNPGVLSKSARGGIRRSIGEQAIDVRLFR